MAPPLLQCQRAQTMLHCTPMFWVSAVLSFPATSVRWVSPSNTPMRAADQQLCAAPGPTSLSHTFEAERCNSLRLGVRGYPYTDAAPPSLCQAIITCERAAVRAGKNYYIHRISDGQQRVAARAPLRGSCAPVSARRARYRTPHVCACRQHTDETTETRSSTRLRRPCAVSASSPQPGVELIHGVAGLSSRQSDESMSRSSARS